MSIKPGDVAKLLENNAPFSATLEVLAKTYRNLSGDTVSEGMLAWWRALKQHPDYKDTVEDEVQALPRRFIEDRVIMDLNNLAATRDLLPGGEQEYTERALEILFEFGDLTLSFHNYMLQSCASGLDRKFAKFCKEREGSLQ